jgi:hypothetical protein
MKKSKRYIKKQNNKPLINKKVLAKVIRRSNICKHAIKELKLAGYGKGEGGPDDWMYQQVIEAVAVFASHGNSGGSAPWEINLVQKLCDWNIISPLRFTDEEWMQISSDGTCQNRRKGNVFKEPVVVFIIMGLLVNELLIDIVLILKNGLKIKILFAGMEDYLNIKIMFLLVDILILVYYMNMILIKDGCLKKQYILIVLK